MLVVGSKATPSSSVDDPSPPPHTNHSPSFQRAIARGRGAKGAGGSSVHASVDGSYDYTVEVADPASPDMTNSCVSVHTHGPTHASGSGAGDATSICHSPADSDNVAATDRPFPSFSPPTASKRSGVTRTIGSTSGTSAASVCRRPKAGSKRATPASDPSGKCPPTSNVHHPSRVRLPKIVGAQRVARASGSVSHASADAWDTRTACLRTG